MNNPVKDGIGKIPLGKGRYAIVDADVYPGLIQYQWSALKGKRGTLYAYRNVSNGKRHKVSLLHREILSAEKGEIVDHRDRNGLDCRRVNMRLCSQSQNNMNAIKRASTTSQYKGVTWNKDDKIWCSQIHVKGKHLHLALCDSEEDAAIYYNVAAQLFFGRFALLNSI